jgi:hypothetical protein
MSAARQDAINHFGARKYAKMTIGQAFEAAPAAVRNGLHPQDHDWIKRFSEVPAREAGARLAVRSRGNPDGVIRGPGRPSEGKDARLEVRMRPDQKTKAEERGAAAGITASAWVLALIDAAP